MSNNRYLILGGRSSLLSRLQISLVAKQLKKLSPNLELKFLFKKSIADQNLNLPLWQTPTKGAFSYEFTELLLQKKIDIVVHSYKDLALEAQKGIEVLPVLNREDQRDLLLFKKSAIKDFTQKKTEQKHKILIYTSSLRRMFLLDGFLQKAFPQKMQNCHIEFASIRGNIISRLEKLIQLPGHGLVLSKAALDRLLLNNTSDLFFTKEILQEDELAIAHKKISAVLNQCEFMVLPLSLCPNAPAQGSLAIEIRKEDIQLYQLLHQLCEPMNLRTSRKERDHLANFGGGCHQKIGIACLERSYGNMQYMRGFDDNNKKSFFKKNFVSTFIINSKQKTCKENKLNQVTSTSDMKKAWPLISESLNFKRKTLSIDITLQPRHAWISRSEAWPENWDNQSNKTKVIWAAGIRTLFSLAQRGLWVHGCSDGLGEQEEPKIDLLIGEKPSFIKLTHQKKTGRSNLPILSSYELEIEKNIPDIRDRNYFFWKSGSQFDVVTAKYPEILQAEHSCGPGLTFEYIKDKVIGPLYIFLDYETWLQTIS